MMIYRPCPIATGKKNAATQAAEAYNNTVAAVSLDGEWLTVRTLKSIETIADSVAPFGYYAANVDVVVEDGIKEYTITFILYPR